MYSVPAVHTSRHLKVSVSHSLGRSPTHASMLVLVISSDGFVENLFEFSR